jgi:tetratricopeptide (TPR) repeat protein
MAKDKADAALEAAKSLASQGKFDAALKKHVWFHDHALGVDEAYYGVRLSFALADWIDLAHKYPPALAALRKIRDTKTNRLLKGKKDYALFHDVQSINEELKEPEATVALFKRIDKMNPRFASAIYGLADGDLIAHREYALARKHLGDPAVRFAVVRRNFEWGMSFAKDSCCKEASERAEKANFTDDAVRIITVLDKAGEHRTAKRIQTEALALLNAPAIRKAIGNRKRKARGSEPLGRVPPP